MSFNNTAVNARAAERKKRIVTHRAKNFAEADEWDLLFWQAKTPQERLSALQDILNDVAMVENSRDEYERKS